MFVSTVIATIGRSSLTRSVESVLSQGLAPADFEVIVVNDSGCPLSSAGWQNSGQVRVLDTLRRERCVARNTGAATARGTYLHFLDDDDWMLPGGMNELRKVAVAGSAAWIYGTSRLVDRDERLLVEHNIGAIGNAFIQVMAGEWLPLQSSLIRADNFFEAGGFDPRLTVCQDKDICRRVALRGDLASTRAAVVCILRDRGRSTTAYDRATAYSIWSRDNVLCENGAFSRMWSSANSPYWRGRFVRAYLTCAFWSLRRGRVIHALNRGTEAAAGFIRSAADLISPAFWSALVRPHTRINVF
jgi:glycosyltransferase involved in cell wall biosynthesis